MVLNRKKTIIGIVSILILIVGISLVNLTLQEPVSENEEQNESVITGEIEKQIKENKDEKKTTFFAQYRIERERVRGKQIELLRDIINDQSQEPRAKEVASERLVAITEDIEKELKAESFIKSKGFKECVVIIMPETTTVVVESTALRVDKEEEIKKLVSSATGCSEDKVSIIIHEPE
ncbi:hypothetical protein SYNTR_0364 [Candidatus Syntrophocurvum alkaliphilum]|uniref:Stage III sporulation protein AH n=1 Tax=Candidatus Syntrophocurvum alkaliphilum TaxID=2293317 RepID=A0A6I6D8X2_9FIRM|nr:SpoIIIAH-like family protein [Candidatus Syntrophocurvum alkaliphilum]QGT98957.1 hypothetical protein SYNTR_0364 [Candidatus Syntrophocurvum alkaliphilum]